MADLETALTIEQIREGIRQLNDQENRAPASIILLDPSFEAFVEEVDDTLACERAVSEAAPEPFSPDELNRALAIPRRGLISCLTNMTTIGKQIPEFKV